MHWMQLKLMDNLMHTNQVWNDKSTLSPHVPTVLSGSNKSRLPPAHELHNYFFTQTYMHKFISSEPNYYMKQTTLSIEAVII